MTASNEILTIFLLDTVTHHGPAHPSGRLKNSGLYVVSNTQPQITLFIGYVLIDTMVRTLVPTSSVRVQSPLNAIRIASSCYWRIVYGHVSISAHIIDFGVEQAYSMSAKV